jgi:hypothetical protein
MINAPKERLKKRDMAFDLTILTRCSRVSRTASLRIR